MTQGRKAEEEEEHVSISQVWARRERVESKESVIPLAVVDEGEGNRDSLQQASKEEVED